MNWERGLNLVLGVLLIAERVEPLYKRFQAHQQRKMDEWAERQRRWAESEEARVQRIWHDEVEPITRHQ